MVLAGKMVEKVGNGGNGRAYYSDDIGQIEQALKGVFRLSGGVGNVFYYADNYNRGERANRADDFAVMPSMASTIPSLRSPVRHSGNLCCRDHRPVQYA